MKLLTLAILFVAAANALPTVSNRAFLPPKAFRHSPPKARDALEAAPMVARDAGIWPWKQARDAAAGWGRRTNPWKEARDALGAPPKEARDACIEFKPPPKAARDVHEMASLEEVSDA